MSVRVRHVGNAEHESAPPVKRTPPRVRTVPIPPAQRVHAVTLHFDRGKNSQLRDGQTIAVLARFVNKDGEPADAEDVRLTIRGPKGTETVEPVREERGVYAYALQLSAGRWKFRVESGGACAAVAEQRLTVPPSIVA